MVVFGRQEAAERPDLEDDGHWVGLFGLGAVWLWGRKGWLCTQMTTSTTGSEKEVVTFCVTLCSITFKIFLRNGPQALSITL